MAAPDGQAPDQPASEQVPGPRGATLLELVAVMDRLRSPGGCPWDAEQTHESLVSYLTEEVHEAVEAIETGDRAAMREELGDVLLQVVFHARIAQEHPTDPWSIDEVAAATAAKLVARHPHVFGDAESPADVESAWLARKAVEKSRESVLDGIPSGLPALLLASKVRYRAVHGHVEAQVAGGEVRDAARRVLAEVGADRIGELLLALAAAATDLGADPESALRAAIREYAATIRTTESAAAARRSG